MRYDVLIAGAGPAGLSAAYTAAAAGARVAVLEKSKEIGYPIHTSGGSWIDDLKKLNIPERFMHPIKQGIFLSQNSKAVFEYEKAPSCILDVRGLYQYLAETASKAGAKIFVNTTVKSPVMTAGKISGLKARRQGREILLHAPLVIDASGYSCVLTRSLNLSQGFQRVGVGAEYDLFAPNWPQDSVAFLLGSTFAPSGYAWVFPHGNQRVCLGVGIIRPDTHEDPQKYLEAILSRSHLFDGTLSDVSRIEYHTGIIPSESHLKHTASDGILIVGDAGGLISTLLGEGIRFAIDIGRMAGVVAGQAYLEKRCDRKFLLQFEQQWKKKYLRLFQVGLLVNKRIAATSDAQWDRRLSLLSKLKPELLPILLKGELNTKNILKIMSSHPDFLRTTILHKLKAR
ncbi:MAG: geranylgeranyl reductase family protein [bacterium]